MPHPFKKIRTKLVLLNMMVFGVIQVAVSVLIIGLRAHYLLQVLDSQLLSVGIRECRTLQPNLEFSNLDLPKPEEEQSPIFSEYYIEILNPEGQMIFRSKNLGGRNIPSNSNANEPASRKPAYQTVGGQQATSAFRHSTSVRTLSFGDDAPRPHLVRIAAPMSVIEERIESLQEIIFLATPIGLLAVGLASYLMARRALAPIGRVAREAQDLTAQRLDKRIEVPRGRDELTEMVIVINQMLDRLQDAFSAQERFIANAAHELKTPLSLLLGKAQVLRQRNRDEADYRQYLETVQTEARRLARIVESLLVLARVDAGLPLPAMEPISINEVVMDAVRECTAYAEPCNVRITPRLAVTQDQDDPQIEGDSELLAIMLSNVIRNAIRFSPARGAVDVSVEQSDTTVLIQVSDEGPGIPQTQIDRLFERFYQADAPHAQQQGSGLGLTIAQGVARLHGGAISIRSTSGIPGCCVQFRFKCANERDQLRRSS